MIFFTKLSSSFPPRHECRGFRLANRIRKFHRDGSDPQELRLMWAHFNRSGKTDEAVDDWDLDSVEWEPEK